MNEDKPSEKSWAESARDRDSGRINKAAKDLVKNISEYLTGDMTPEQETAFVTRVRGSEKLYEALTTIELHLRLMRHDKPR